MTDAEFRELVRKMRATQRHYFQHRDPASLRGARDYERLVDKALDDKAQPRLTGLAEKGES